MSLFHKAFNCLRKTGLGITSIKTLNELFIIKKIRHFATEEVALTKMKFQSSERRKKNILRDSGNLVLLIIPVSAFGLGTWQVFRLFEKEEQNKDRMKHVLQPPIEFPKNLDELKDLEYQKVRVKGKFDHSKEIYFGPRSKIDKFSFSQISSLISRSTAGFLIITPFTLSDRNLTILVNRGWVPVKQKKPVARPEGQITEEVEFVGLVRHSEKRQPLGVKNSPEKGVWLFRDLEEMAKVTGAAPILIDADFESSVPGGPIGGQTVIGFPNKHLSYIYTWYGLSAVSGYLWYLKNFKKTLIKV